MRKPVPYFKSVPVAGKASPPGFAQGVRDMSTTLETLDILGGRIEWRGPHALIIPPSIYSGGGGLSEHDHSFHFTSTGADAGTVTDGFYRLGDGNAVEITPAELADTTTRWYWVKADYSSNRFAPTVTWANNGTGFPDGTADILIYPIFSFDADGICTERRQTDIQLPETFDPDNLSLDWDMSEPPRLQLYHWDVAGSTSPGEDALIPYQAYAGRALRYLNLDDLIDMILEAALAAVPIPAVDDISIDRNGQAKIQWKNWDIAVPGAALPPESLVGVKEYKGGGLDVNVPTSYHEVLRYRPIDSFGGGRFWELGETYLKCYGASIGFRSGIGAAVQVIDLGDRKLENGAWAVTDTTPAAEGVGGLVLDGGLSASHGVYADRGSAAAAGMFRTLGGANVDLCTDDHSMDAAGDVNIDATSVYQVDNVAVVGAQGAALPADATDLDSAIALLNAIKARMEAHGLVAAA